MNAAMAHRGPDALGTWESPPDDRGFGVLLGHRRLSILDLSEAGRQPMVDSATGHVIVFNGEIYNYVALRESLAARGERFESTGDTAVMLRALGVQGNDAVGQFRGMFAFAFWDIVRRQLSLARDALGIKPLYFARAREPGAEWSIAFASEVRALLASGLLGKPRLDPDAAASMVWNGFIMGPQTAVEGIESLWPGELRVLDGQGRELLAKTFWRAPPAGELRTEATDELEQTLEEGLRLHLASDVPLAVFLSGGIDSSVVANLAQRAARSPIHTFTLAFEEEQYNEGPSARRIAAAIGTRHREILLTQSDFVSGLDAAIGSLDQPTFDGLNSYFMSRAIREAGFTVALVGTGGDELFGGYSSFRDLPILERYNKQFGWVPRTARIAGARLVARAMQPSRGAIAPQTRWAKLPDIIRRGDDRLGLYQLTYALFLPAFQRRLLKGDPLKDGMSDAMRARIDEEMRGRSPLSAVSMMEQRVFLGERLLRDNDAASMAVSIEQRLPLVDRVLLETVCRLQDRVRYEPVGKKSLLRRVGLRGIDPSLFDRPKSGFVLPFDRWIRLGLGDVMDRTMRDPEAVRSVGLNPEAVGNLWGAFLAGAPGLYWSRVWALYVLIRWSQTHGAAL
jgi:asparagine synthase (glutamine-hydrolysing)